MAGDITRLGSSAARAHGKALDQVRRDTDVATARVMGATQVAQAALMGTLSISMIAREAAFVVPEAAGRLELIATQAALSMAMQINRIGN
jgi:hypothetical protein